jgi:hypothetical protein
VACRRTTATAAPPPGLAEFNNFLTAMRTYNLVRIRGHREIDSQMDFTSATYTGPEALLVRKDHRKANLILFTN